MPTEYFTLRDVCTTLRVEPYKVTYLLATRQVPEPLRVGGRRVFTALEVERIKEFLDADKLRRLQIKQGGTP